MGRNGGGGEDRRVCRGRKKKRIGRKENCLSGYNWAGEKKKRRRAELPKKYEHGNGKKDTLEVGILQERRGRIIQRREMGRKYLRRKDCVETRSITYDQGENKLASDKKEFANQA